MTCTLSTLVSAKPDAEVAFHFRFVSPFIDKDSLVPQVPSCSSCTLFVPDTTRGQVRAPRADPPLQVLHFWHTRQVGGHGRTHWFIMRSLHKPPDATHGVSGMHEGLPGRTATEPIGSVEAETLQNPPVRHWLGHCWTHWSGRLILATIKVVTEQNSLEPIGSATSAGKPQCWSPDHFNPQPVDSTDEPKPFSMECSSR